MLVAHSTHTPLLAVLAASAVLCPPEVRSAVSSATEAALPDVLTRSIASYPSLKTYADTGTAVEEHTGFSQRARFTTAFRAPNDFFFEYSHHVSEYPTGQTVTSPTHLVLWMLGGEMQKWDGALKTHDVMVDAGAQVAALAGAGAASASSVIVIMSLIFVTAGILGPVQELVDARVAGEEAVTGRRCHKVTGVARSVYPSGAITNVRPLTVWIDAETLLIRKVFEDTPKGYPAGNILRRTLTFEPRANAPLDDGRFRYKVPS